MDFLDPKKSRAHMIRLITGYVLMAIALVMATTLLLDIASGFGVRQGKVIQNGLVFLSSNPSEANIYLNGQLHNDRSNARLILPAGTYTMKLTRDGYRDWQRALTVEGGGVDHFDYPLLIPRQLSPTAISGYPAPPPLATESPDRRWLVVQSTGQAVSFDVYDLRDPERVRESKTAIALPANIVGLPQSGSRVLKVVEWSRDNDHLLLEHIVGDQSEYIMLSRTKPEESFNLTRKLQLPSGVAISLQDKKFDRYFLHDKTAQTLTTATFDNTTPVPLLTGVIDYKSYGQDVVLYATADGADEGKVSVKLYQDKKSHTIRQIAKHENYLLDITAYDSRWYAAAGSPAEDHVYVYEDPAERIKRNAGLPPVPVDILKIAKPSYIEFSANSQFLLAENGQDIATFDAENERSYTYRIDKTLDTPQTHVTWMDGYHLRLVSGGQVTIFDYDGTNMQTLTASDAAYLAFFDTAYQTLYALAPAGSGENLAGQHSLFATSLRTEPDR